VSAYERDNACEYNESIYPILHVFGCISDAAAANDDNVK